VPEGRGSHVRCTRHRLLDRHRAAQRRGDAEAFLELWRQTRSFETFGPAAKAMLFGEGGQ